MNFYKTVSIIALIVLIICLAVIGTSLSNAKKDIYFPPNIPSCPDKFKMGANNMCSNPNPSTNGVDVECDEDDFSDASYKNPGIGAASGACAKKKWAINCGVDWDGITNNPDVCYSTN